jgi:hypothetical protein
MFNPPQGFELYYFYVLLLVGVSWFFYMLMTDCVPMVLNEWGKPVKEYLRNRKRGELEEIERK